MWTKGIDGTTRGLSNSTSRSGRPMRFGPALAFAAWFRFVSSPSFLLLFGTMFIDCRRSPKSVTSSIQKWGGARPTPIQSHHSESTKWPNGHLTHSRHAISPPFYWGLSRRASRFAFSSLLRLAVPHASITTRATCVCTGGRMDGGADLRHPDPIRSEATPRKTTSVHHQPATAPGWRWSA